MIYIQYIFYNILLYILIIVIYSNIWKFLHIFIYNKIINKLYLYINNIYSLLRLSCQLYSLLIC